MLENAWLIPLTMAASFVVILFFGKRMPKKGAEIGILAIGACFVLSVIAALRVDRQGGPPRARGGRAPPDLVQVRQRRPRRRHPRRRPDGDDALRRHLHLADGARLLDGLHARRPALHVLLRRPVPVHRGHAPPRRRRQHPAAADRLGAGRPLLVHADRPLVGGDATTPTPPSRPSSPPASATSACCSASSSSSSPPARTSTSSTSTTRPSPAASATRCSLVGASLLFLGVIGKSAQFPLHVWLPDAMAGPTPVSALIHAATMVVAGVYLVARLYGVFWEGFSIAAGGINPMALIGAITVIACAALAFVQDDVKKVLAYSTVSQLGYMVMALGVGRLDGRHLPPLHPRLLQGPALPRRRLAHPRRPLQQHERHGRAAKTHADHVRRRSSSARWRWPASSRSPASGRRTRSSSAP